MLTDYGRFLDARDLVAYSKLFAKDGEWVGGFGSAKGPEGFWRSGAKNLGTAANRANNYHILSNFEIEVQGDSAYGVVAVGLHRPRRRRQTEPGPRRALSGQTGARKRPLEVPAPRGVQRSASFGPSGDQVMFRASGLVFVLAAALAVAQDTPQAMYVAASTIRTVQRVWRRTT